MKNHYFYILLLLVLQCYGRLGRFGTHLKRNYFLLVDWLGFMSENAFLFSKLKKRRKL